MLERVRIVGNIRNIQVHKVFSFVKIPCFFNRKMIKLYNEKTHSDIVWCYLMLINFKDQVLCFFSKIKMLQNYDK